MMFFVGPTPPHAMEIQRARLSAGIEDKVVAAQTIWIGSRQWYRYESGASDMPIGLWELFLIKNKLSYRVMK